ncbi:MAG: hypothetical protein N2169_00970 [bacterium]|nr:hypothetical protein [bacterium]
MNINQFEGTIAYFVISRLAGGEILENYVKDQDILQPLLEYSLNYIENYESFKNDLNNFNSTLAQYSPNFKLDKLKSLNFIYSNMKVFFCEIKEDDIFAVIFFSASYPDGIVKIFLNEYINYVKQNYSL